jgi:hypothetical protein
MTSGLPFAATDLLAPCCRVSVLLPRMPDCEATILDPFEQGVPWATRLLATAGVGACDEIREDQTLLVATSMAAFRRLQQRWQGPAVIAHDVGGLLIPHRLRDTALPCQKQCPHLPFEIVELAFPSSDLGEIERVISALPFKAYRVEDGRNASLNDASFLDFDWQPELPRPGWRRAA